MTAPSLRPGTPEWWLHRLGWRLAARQPWLARLERYYCGDHPLPAGPDQAKAEFRAFQRKARANWLALVVDAVTERMHVSGFRFGKDEASDEAAWTLWQANCLDADAELVHTEALVCGESYVIVGPNPDDPTTPLITAEHPRQVIVERAPGRLRERRAALKVWLDDVAGRWMATVYLPDAVYRYQSPPLQLDPIDPTHWPVLDTSVFSTGRSWERRAVPGEPWPVPNPSGRVPVVPFANRPRLLDGGVSEIADLIDIQDRINLTILNRLTAERYGAFRQRWMSVGGMLDRDPVTNEPVVPFKPSQHRLWVVEDDAARFGEFGATDLGGYIASAESDIRGLAAVSKTPPHYLIGSVVNASGDALKAAETGLVSKVKRRMVHFGESWEEALRIAFALLGDTTRAESTGAETLWTDPESRTLGEVVDAAVKKKALDVPWRQIMLDLGYSPQLVARWETDRDQADEFTQLVAALARQSGEQPVAGPPVPPVAQPPPGPPRAA